MLLAMDTSTQWMSLALFDGAQVIAEHTWRTSNHHSVELSPAIIELMKQAQVRMDALTGLAIALGPGSFTSLRIGLAVAKGMAFALRLPIAGIPTLEILASAIPVQNMPLAAVLQAGRSRIAVGWFDAVKGKWKPQGEVRVTTVHELEQEIKTPTLVAGELSADDRQVLERRWKNVHVVNPALSLRRAGYLAEMGWSTLQSGKRDDPVSLSPIYLHVAGEIPA
jgi:tRNA threonylcarbamoyladenosine biosynthesis protein TsaB